MKAGALLVATGPSYRAEARLAVDSLRRQMPKLPITVLTDMVDVFNQYDLDRVVEIDGERNGYLNKVRSLRRTNYERTLYLDTDTYVTDDVSELFGLLDEFDIGAAHAPGRGFARKKHYEVPESFPEYNTGVIVYQSSGSVESLLETWEELFRRNLAGPDDGRHPHDQISFRKALFESQVRVATLLPEYNCRFIFPGYLQGKAKILHGRGESPSRAEDTLNGQEGMRVHYCGIGGLKVRRNLLSRLPDYLSRAFRRVRRARSRLFG